MHVTIVQLTTNKHDWEKNHVDEADVFANNPGVFYDGVEEHHDGDFHEDVETLYETLGQALAAHGLERDGERDVIWIEVDPAKTDSLFDDPWVRFKKAAMQLGDVSGPQFRTDIGHEVETALQKIREAYNFDWMYVIDETGHAVTIAEWLRDLRREHASGEKPGKRRFYLHATYDGDQ